MMLFGYSVEQGFDLPMEQGRGRLAWLLLGETYFVDGSGDVAFTGQNSNNIAGLFDFPAREYSSVQGRWLSPDPAGLAAVDASDPQTRNRYAYVRNGPLNTTDPSGLDNTPGECFFDPFCNLTTWGFPVPTPSSFLPNPTPPIDWQTILFGPFNPSLLIFNWTACYNANIKLVSCTDPSAVIYCSDAASPDEAPAQQPSGACNNSMPQYAIGRHRFPANNATPQSPTQSRAVCAANLADKYSIAGAVGTTGKQGFFANVFNGVAGNTFSGLTLAFSGGGNKYRLGTSINNATFGGTGAAINAVTTPAPITELGLTETVGGGFLGKGLGGIFTLGKLGYDAASFTAAYFSSTCRSGG